MRKLLLIVLGFVFICGISTAAELKIGYVDFEKVFNDYEKTKTQDAQLKTKLEKKKIEFDAKKEELNKLRDSMELLGDEARAEKQKEMREKIAELNTLRNETEEKLLEERNKMWLEIYEEIKGVVTKYGKDNGYSLIFDDKALVYKLDSYDITVEIVKILNKKK